MTSPRGGYVLDASALLASLLREPGGEEVSSLIDGAAISTVNWSEVYRRCLVAGVDVRRDDLEDMGLEIYPFSSDDAEGAAALWSAGRGVGLSLADRACLALAARLEATAVTCDRAWAALEIGVHVRSVR